MWQDKVKEVINILENSNVNEIEITFWGRKIRVVKNASSILSNSVSATPETIIQNDKISNNMRHEDDTEKIDSGEKILSPMPGVFYSSQAPEKPPFVSEGDKVKVGQVLCIIESMKIIWERLKIICEPSCSLPLAAVIKNKETFKNKKVGIIISGGNVDLNNLPF